MSESVSLSHKTSWTLYRSQSSTDVHQTCHQGRFPENVVTYCFWWRSKIFLSHMYPQKHFLGRTSSLSQWRAFQRISGRPIKLSSQNLTRLPQYMTSCLGIRNATYWADTRFIEHISCCSYFWHFSFFIHPLRGLGATYDVHARFIGRRVVNFPLVLVERFSLGVTAEALRAKIDRKLAGGSVSAKFSCCRRGRPQQLFLYR